MSTNPRYRYGMNWIRQEKRLALYMRDGFACAYCGRGVESAEMILTLDHVEHMGSNDASNLVTACFDCNIAKGRKRLTKFVRDERVLKRIAKLLARDLQKRLPEAKEIIRQRKSKEPF